MYEKKSSTALLTTEVARMRWAAFNLKEDYFMPHKGPHISISPDFVVNRILRINLEDFIQWPESVRHLAIEIAEELFLVVYNPFVNAETVKVSVASRFEQESFSLAHHYATSISEGITLFWSAYSAQMEFRDQLVRRLSAILPEDAIVTRGSALVACSTDATDLRMELPILVVEPSTAEQVCELVRLANEMKFALIPRGGASGMTGGAVPARKRSVVVRVTRFSKIWHVDPESMSVRIEAGVITQTAVDSAAKDGFLLTIDPASKTASTIGGNIAENSGGPYAFEYGTTLDNLLSWRMVTPTGELITIERKDHSRHKILPQETVTFEVKDVSGGVRSVVELRGDEIRLPALGKDVTNKALGGLPGMQKEGIDGIILDGTFIVHKKLKYSRVMILEFYGRSMHQAAVVIGQIVDLRNQIRKEGDYAHLSALEEFNAKYVRAIDYKRKSQYHKGLPISVILIQADGDDPELLNQCVQRIAAIVKGKEDEVALIVAKDQVEADLFWEDRHKLSAIAKKTSGFKINEDVVIPMAKIPEFALFLEQLNLECVADVYRQALQRVIALPGMALEDTEINREFLFSSKAAQGKIPASEISDQEMEDRALLFVENLAGRYEPLAAKIRTIAQDMLASRVLVASHMHAGDGNWHVNIPVNSNNLKMLESAEEVARRVMAQAQTMGGVVSGEHGIGITKITFLDKVKMEAIQAFKKRVDPRDIFNPAKLTQSELPVKPFTFSFNRLKEDISQSGLPDKERLIKLLTSVQDCTRCGKCKHVCPMMYPEKSYHYHPRNKNMVLGAMIEAIYYSQITGGRPDPSILAELRGMIEHCTGCGRCTAVCPIKIPSADVALELRAFLEEEGAGGHPLKDKIFKWLLKDPARRIPKAAKAASFGQRVQNSLIPIVPPFIRHQLYNPLFSGKGPKIGYRNLDEALHLQKGNIFVPSIPDTEKTREAVLYFPGCGGSLFARTIGFSVLALLLRSNVSVVIPNKHLCCGYPLASSGVDMAFRENRESNMEILASTIAQAENTGLRVSHIITACGSCRDALEHYDLKNIKLADGGNLIHQDALQFTLPRLQSVIENWQEKLFSGSILYHASCHPEWVGVHKVKGARIQADALAKVTGADIQISSGCCGESGMGAIASPLIYNILRARKQESLASLLPQFSEKIPILVGCPSCRIGIARILMNLKKHRPVMHTAEWLASLLFKDPWGTKWIRVFRRRIALVSEHLILSASKESGAEAVPVSKSLSLGKGDSYTDENGVREVEFDR